MWKERLILLPRNFVRVSIFKMKNNFGLIVEILSKINFSTSICKEFSSFKEEIKLEVS